MSLFINFRFFLVGLLAVSGGYHVNVWCKFMVDQQIDMPAYSSIGEPPAKDGEFEVLCENEALSIAMKENWTISSAIVTKNPKFGLVWRADFRFEDGVDTHVNRIILWKLPNGHLARFFGSNLHVAPLTKL